MNQDVVNAVPWCTACVPLNVFESYFRVPFGRKYRMSVSRRPICVFCTFLGCVAQWWIIILCVNVCSRWSFNSHLMRNSSMNDNRSYVVF